MHEAGLMASVLDIIDQSRVENNIRRVTEITLKVGVLNGALPDALQFAFDALRSEYTWLDASSVLRIESVPAILLCFECHYQGPGSEMTCPACQSVLTQLIQGEEFDIVGFDGEVDESRKDRSLYEPLGRGGQ
ncbi:hydrogenase maturation nickel metallochaperone HypA [Sulfobacillus thermosulfidooxidans]|uniref:Hydrogenase maturation factor HypA n=1 Tax=Sulfobacillus thermosulfidooxidans TaxID=28034 RepID=A0A1R0IV57_SULTH|nr:hydrogenase maturation nickel metallochaperone HypA [Sulfobacillus thermosulfidooxidans]OLZ11934.1 hydrogenase nickel incorporation protein HypA [Sulfobacillus thermosulfidooxidans]OLZ17617.1 hydrogenase nickel incorporation protein HypA [Sulfobacillus thermosulfidooxidans]OLZ22398.1 hydrogenase nickel incorporation protein HypA [Sulfobacillus thermosulfidooxidans]PSR28748.1 MAG: hydrogenase maturation nickel metallochaperone HypA [Sulfobacillus thermosulfidooxidans]